MVHLSIAPKKIVDMTNSKNKHHEGISLSIKYRAIFSTKEQPLQLFCKQF